MSLDLEEKYASVGTRPAECASLETTIQSVSPLQLTTVHYNALHCAQSKEAVLSLDQGRGNGARVCVCNRAPHRSTRRHSSR
jgi:hypothetical protein